MKKILFIFMLAPLLFIAGCKKPCHDASNPECDNYDPCYGHTIKNADFDAFQIISSSWVGEKYASQELIVDTALAYSLHFMAKSEWINYKWVIGIDTFYKKDVYLDFNNITLPQTIKICLIAEYQKDSLCFPQEKGRDTLTKSIYFIGDRRASLCIGRFHGYYDDNPQDTGTIEIEIALPYDNNYPGRTNLFKISKDTTCMYNYYWDDSYKKIAFTSLTCGPEGVATISANNNNEIKVVYNETPRTPINASPEQHKFIGWRIP